MRMNKTTFAVLAVMCAVPASGVLAQKGVMSKTMVSTMDKTFMKAAAQGGMAEVNLSKLAVERGGPTVKQFGQMMIEDHTKANEELMGIAESKKVVLPKTMKPDAVVAQKKMSKLNGAAFDKFYVAFMLKDHQKDVADFSKEAKMGKDEDVKGFAAKTLPVVQGHLTALKGMKSGGKMSGKMMDHKM